MSLLFCDSASHYATAGILTKWSSVVSTTGNAVVDATGGLFAGSLNLPNNSGNQSNVTRAVPVTSSFVIGFRFNPSGLPGQNVQLVRLLDAGSAQCDLRFNTDGTLTVTRNGTALTGGTSVATIPLNSWTYIEWKVTIADSIGANTCQVRLNGNTSEVINVTTGQDTKNTANTTASQVSFGPAIAPTQIRTFKFTDIYIVSQDATAPNDWCGDCRVDVILPNGAGDSTDWTPNTGTNWEAVDDATSDGDTTYVETTTSGHVDLYAMQNLPTTPARIWAIQAAVAAKKTDAGARAIQPAIKTGGTQYNGTSQSLSNSELYYLHQWGVNPDTTAEWTKAQVDALQAGVRDNS